MAAKRESFDRFARAERRAGGKHGSYAKSISRAAALKDNELLRNVVIDILFCMLLPPYGIYRLCTQDREEPAVRLVGIALSVIIMYLWFSALIPSEKPEPLAIDRIRAAAVQSFHTSV